MVKAATPKKTAPAKMAVKGKGAEVKPAAAKKTTKAKPAPKQDRREGRPTVYSSELAERICELIAEGNASRAICKTVGIGERTLYTWLAEKPDFQQQYARARERQADFYAQQIIAISDEVTVEARHQGEDVLLDVSSSAVARNRLRIDSRKWIASKLAPKKYGDKLQVGGADDLPPIQSNSTVVISADEAYKRMLSGGAQ